MGRCTEGFRKIKKLGKKIIMLFFLKIKKIELIIYSSLIIGLLITNLIPLKTSSAITVDRVLATVGNEVITLADYKQFIKSIIYVTEDADVKENSDIIDEEILNRLIEDRIILQEAKNKGIEVSEKEINAWIDAFKRENELTQEEFEELLMKEKLSIDDYKNIAKKNLVASKLINLAVDSKIVVTDKDIESYYHEHKNKFIKTPKTVEVGAIFLKLKKDASITEITDLKLKALKISYMLKQGASFDILVDEYSDEPLKSQDGKLGEFTEGELISALDKKIFSMEKGEISEPIWFNDGVYILRLIDKKEAIYKPIEEVKVEIYDYLFNQKKEKLFNNWIKSLWETYSVKINQD